MAVIWSILWILFVIPMSSFADTVPVKDAMFDGIDMPKPIANDPAKPVFEGEDDDANAQSEQNKEEVPVTAPPQFEAVQIYTQEELIKWINKNIHLNQVLADECQLVQDIEARADKMRLPTYQFLWGDMLAWGVCVEQDAKLGFHYFYLAAEQGLPAALEQLGRYYWRGILVQPNHKKAVVLLREAASLGFLKAQIEYVEILNTGAGSPHDYEEAYRWLHGAIIGDKNQYWQARRELRLLAQKMPENIVKRAKAQAGAK